MSALRWPETLTAHRVEDAALSAAHESAPAAGLAAIKQCLALLHSLMGEDADETLLARIDAARGFRMRERIVPAPWACFFVGAGYAAPVRLAAALMPAILARTPLLAAVCVSAPSPAVLAALELAGVEDIFRVDDAAPWPARLSAGMGPGRVALLHGGDLAPAAEAARGAGLAVWEETRPPRLHMEEEAEPFRDIIDFCHPDAVHTPSGPDAVFGGEGGSPDVREAAPLIIHPRMAGFWRHAGLGPDFFRERALRIAPPEEDTGEET